MTLPGQVGRTARLLGYAGLLPQVAAVLLIVTGVPQGCRDLAAIRCTFGYVSAMAYGLLILSFLGGMWWGFAMRREADQGWLAATAVLPSLTGAGIAIRWSSAEPTLDPWLPVLLGSAIILTLPVDRYL